MCIRDPHVYQRSHVHQSSKNGLKIIIFALPFQRIRNGGV